MSYSYNIFWMILRHNNKTYKVDDISWDMRPTDTFEKGGEKISYKKYFEEVNI